MMELVLMASIIIPVTARVSFLVHTVKRMQMIASQVLVYMEGSYFYFLLLTLCKYI